MTGSQLKALRQAYGWSQRDVAAKLVDVTDVTVSRWEAAKDREIPTLAAERLLSGLELRLPLTELRTLLDIAIRRGVDFDTVLHEALREYIARYAKAKGVSVDELNEAMVSQAAKMKKLIAQGSQPPVLHVAEVPQEEYGAGTVSGASARKPKGKAS